MNLRIPKFTRWIGYVVFAIASLIVFLHWTIPFDRIQSLVEQSVARSGNRITIGSMGSSLFFGVYAEDVVLRLKPKSRRRPAFGRAGAGAKAAEKPKAQIVKLGRVEFKLGLIGMLRLAFGTVAADFDIEGLGGQIVGEIIHKKNEGTHVELTAESLNVRRVPYLKAGDLPFSGALSAKIELDVPKRRINAANGRIELEGSKLAVGDNKAKLKIPGNAFLAMGVTLPKTRLGSLNAAIEVRKGRASVKEFETKSGDIDLKLEGSIALRKPMSLSNLNLYAMVRVDESAKAKEPKLKLLEDGLAKGKRSDGFYGIAISGPVSRARPRVTSKSPSDRKRSTPSRSRRKRSRKTKG